MRGDQAVRLLRASAELGDEHRAIDLATVVEIHARLPGVTGEPPPDAELEALLAQAREAAVPGDRLAEGWIAMAQAWVPFRSQELGPAERAVALAREVDDPVLLSAALDAIAGLHLAAGRPGLALAATRERARAAARMTGSRGRQFLERRDYLYMLAVGHTRVGRLREALPVIEEGRLVELEAGVDYGAFARGLDCLFMLGEWDQVERHLEEFVRVWEAAGRPTAGFARMELTMGAVLHGLRGDHERWLRFRDVSLRLGTARMGDVDPRSGHPGVGVLLVCDAAIDLHFGRYAEAAERLRLAPAEVSGWARSTWGAVRAEAYVRAGEAEAARAIAEGQDVVDEDAVAAAWILRARALLAADEAQLRAARDAFAALGMPYELARTQLDLGGAEAEQALETYRRLGLVQAFGG
jgi:hypothetical protein